MSQHSFSEPPYTYHPNLIAPFFKVATFDERGTCTIKVESTRWIPGKSHSKDFYWDEALFNHKLEKNNPDHQSLFPPSNMDLADAWVVKIVDSDMRQKDRNERWPAVFSHRYVVSSYRNKGRSAKSLDPGANV